MSRSPLLGGWVPQKKEVSDLKSKGPEVRSSFTASSWVTLNRLLKLLKAHFTW